MSTEPPESLNVSTLQDRHRGELWPPGDPTAAAHLYLSVMATLVALFSAWLLGGLGQVVASVAGFLLGLVAARALWRLLRFPAPFEVGSKIVLGELEFAASQLTGAELLEDPLGILVHRGERSDRVWVDDHHYSTQDMEWIVDRLREQVSDPDTTEPRPMRPVQWAAITVGLWSLGCGADFGQFDQASFTPATQPYAPGQCTSDSVLRWQEPSPQEAGSKPPKGVQRVHYPAAPGELVAWWIPPADGPAAPAVLYLHGGLAIEPLMVRQVQPLADRGWAVMMPAVRGENGNPGNYEFLCGEVDDVAAAVRWVATQPGVDPSRIAVFGHSAGGALSALMSLHPTAPVVTTGSVGGLYFDELLHGMSAALPFDPHDPTEVQRRLLLSQLPQMQRPHRAYLGRDDVLALVVAPARAHATAVNAPLTVEWVDGDHHASAAPALARFIAELGW